MNMKRGRIAKLMLTIMLMSTLLFAVTAHATSLSDLANSDNSSSISNEVLDTKETSAATETASGTTGTTDKKTDEKEATTVQENDKKISVAGLSYNMLEEDKTSKQVTDGISSIVSTIVQYIIFAIGAFSILLVVIDVLYIILPPSLRSFLAPQAAGMAGGMGGMQGGMGGMQGGMGGMQGGMGMRGGYGGGYGMRGGYGGGYGMRGGYGGGMGMNRGMGMQGGGMSANPMAGRGGGQWVSDSAVQAVMMSQQQPGVSAFGMYMKSMSVTIILSLVICIVAASGVLTTIGIGLGKKLSTLLGGVSDKLM